MKIPMDKESRRVRYRELVKLKGTIHNLGDDYERIRQSKIRKLSAQVIADNHYALRESLSNNR